MEQWMVNWWFAYLVLPILIFSARILDVSLGTIRILFISRGIKTLASVLGFFEVFIWLLVISSLMNNLSSPFYYLFYAAGFAAGNYMGMVLEQRLQIGKVALRVITRENSDDLVNYFRENNLGLTVVDAEGSKGPVRILFSIIDRTKLDKLIARVTDFNPRAFYSVEDVKTASQNFSMPMKLKRFRRNRPVPLRKGK